MKIWHLSIKHMFNVFDIERHFFIKENISGTELTARNSECYLSLYRQGLAILFNGYRLRTRVRKVCGLL